MALVRAADAASEVDRVFRLELTEAVLWLSNIVGLLRAQIPRTRPVFLGSSFLDIIRVG
jgi:hypothetical protein